MTASLQFFRSIGGAVGAALLGSLMTNRFTEGVQNGLRSLLAPVQAHAWSLTQNAQALINATNAEIAQALAPYGAAGEPIAAQIETIRATAIANGIDEVFLIGAALAAVAMVAAFFLHEIPLRAAHGDTGAHGVG